jgi:spermidine synthase
MYAGIAFVLLFALRVRLAMQKRRSVVVGVRGVDRFVVRKEDGFRELLIVSPTHEQVQSRQDLKNDLSSGRGYVDGFHVAMIGRESTPTRVLFIGGGACVGPRQFEAAYPEATIDVVESEGLVIEAAKKHFGLVTSPRLRVHIGDGRLFLHDAKPYDVVVIDTYDAYRMPGRLVTKEFFAEVREAMRPDGAVVLNLVGSLRRTLVPGILAALAVAFDGWEIAVFDVPDESEGRHVVRNFIVLVTAKVPDVAAAAVKVAPYLGEITAKRREVTIDPERAFTDEQPRTWIPVTE